MTLASMVFGMAVVGCKPKDEGVAPTKEALWPFPSAHLMENGRVALPAEFGVGLGGTEFPVDRLGWRTGFSPVQTTALDLGSDIDGSTLPSVDGTGDAIQLWDLTDGVRLPAWAELDAYPMSGDEAPSVLVRPLRPMPMGHEVAVVVTAELRHNNGDPVAVEWFDAVVSGEGELGDLAEWTSHYQGLLGDLAALGIEDVVFATDYPISDPRGPMVSMAAAVEVPDDWAWQRTEDVDLGDELPAGLWRRGEGSLQSANWLEDDIAFVWEGDLPAQQGEAEVEFWAYVPDAARTAKPGTVPVWIFGHGIFSEPDLYLDDDDPSGVIELANRAGAIVVATVWRGLTYSDLPVAVTVGGDFGRIPEMTDKLAQGVANTRAMMLLMTEGSLFDDPLFGGLADRETVRYFGISLGGIEGAVFLANSPEVPYGVLHVGGSDWSYMLERSSNWPTFESLVVQGIPSARDRQLLYAASQLFWDEADPAMFTEELAARRDLWQMSLGDEQVPNVATELLARGIGATVLLPAEGFAGDLPTGVAPMTGPALSVFDPMVAYPDDVNRPAPETGAHSIPRHWAGAQLQTVRFLDPVDPGVVQHYCGTEMCSADNTGE